MWCDAVPSWSCRVPTWICAALPSDTTMHCVRSVEGGTVMGPNVTVYDSAPLPASVTVTPPSDAPLLLPPLLPLLLLPLPPPEPPPLPLEVLPEPPPLP